MMVPKAKIRERVTNRMVCERVNFWGNGVPLRSCLNCLKSMVGFLSFGLVIPRRQSNARSMAKRGMEKAYTSSINLCLTLFKHSPNIFKPLPLQTPQYLSPQSFSSTNNSSSILNNLCFSSALLNFAYNNQHITSTFIFSQSSLNSTFLPSFLHSTGFLFPINNFLSAAFLHLQLWNAASTLQYLSLPITTSHSYILLNQLYLPLNLTISQLLFLNPIQHEGKAIMRNAMVCKWFGVDNNLLRTVRDSELRASRCSLEVARSDLRITHHTPTTQKHTMQEYKAILE